MLSVGLAIAMHGAALAFAVYWQGPGLRDAPVETISVELIDAAEWEAAASAEKLATSGALKSEASKPDPVSEPAPTEVGTTETASLLKPAGETAPASTGLHRDEELTEMPDASPDVTEPARIATALPVTAPPGSPVAEAQPGPVQPPLALSTPATVPPVVAPSKADAPVKTASVEPSKAKRSTTIRETKSQPSKPSKTAAPAKSPKPVKAAKAKGGGKEGKAANGFANVPSASLASYKATVHQRIQSRRPSGLRAPRAARVAFAIGPSGALRYASISTSSGNAAFDNAVLAAVRRAAPFPPPPKGTMPAQLQFVLPFTSR